MKRMMLVLPLVAWLAFPAGAPAQDAAEPPPEDLFEGEPPPGEPLFDGPPHGAPRRGPDGEPPLERWMENVRKDRPEEFERLQRLRNDDPRAFRQELHQRVRQEKVMARLRDYPRLHEALAELPPDQREDAVKKLLAAHMPKGMSQRMQRMNPESRRLEAETMGMSKAYRACGDDAEKERIRTDLRLKLTELFDLREAERRAQVARMEEDLGKIRGSLEQRERHRDEIIDRRLQELTDGDVLKW